MPVDIAKKNQITLEQAAKIRIARGGHDDRSNGLCILEIGSWLMAAPHGDNPPISNIIGTFMRVWNDAFPDNAGGDADRDRLLRPLLPYIIKTTADNTAEYRRAWMVLDWMIREMTPAWLRTAKLNDIADALSCVPEIEDPPSLETVMKTLLLARDKSAAARDAAGDAARAAAGDAAWDAAGAAAWAAARDAAGDAARAALKPTVEQLQASAVELVKRMCDVEGKSVPAS